MSVRSVPAEDVSVGDEVIFLGRHHIVREVAPYVGAIGSLDTSDWRIAKSEDGWALTLIPGQTMWVAA